MRNIVSLSLFLLLAFTQVSNAYIPYGYSGFTNPSTSSATLPLTGNLPGDVRVDLTAFNLYVWTGSSWQCDSCGGGGGGGVTSYNGLTGAVSSRWTTSTVSTNTTVPTLTNFELLNVDTSSGPLIITLPDAGASNGFCIKIKNIGSPVHTNTINPPGVQTIDYGSFFCSNFCKSKS